MTWLRSVGWAVVVALHLVAASAASAQTPSPSPTAHKSVYGQLESVAKPGNGVIMRSDAGERLAWRFPARVVTELGRFKPGDRMIVIYRQTSPNEKRVTAVAFPGSADAAVYVNLTGASVLLRSGSATDGVCGGSASAPIDETTIPDGGRAEALGACWCCAQKGETCSPGNKTGIGEAFLVGCFE